MIKRAVFNNNYAGRQGSAIFVKGINLFKIEASKVTANKAVNVLEEI